MEVTVAEFRVAEHQRLVDLTQHKPGETQGIKGVFATWPNLDRAFARPVTRDDVDRAPYAATQAISELFKKLGYAGVRYRSSLRSGGFNYALFSLQAAVPVRRAVFTVKSIGYAFERTILIDEISGDPDDWEEERWFPCDGV